MYYSSKTSNKVSEQLFIDKNGILVECCRTYVDDFDFNHKKRGLNKVQPPDRISMNKIKTDQLLGRHALLTINSL